MYEDKRILAIIPARRGPKRLPRKNVLDLAGKPLIAWTIAAANACPLLDRTILSSDDAEIISTARHYGCDVPFVRPAELADDAAGSADVVIHALDALADTYDYVVLLQPTTPLRTVDDISRTVRACIDSSSSSAVTTCSLQKPKSYFGKTENGIFQFADFFGDVDAGCVNGAVYVVEVERFRKSRAFYAADTRAHQMPALRSIDIDELHEFKMAEALARISMA